MQRCLDEIQQAPLGKRSIYDSRMPHSASQASPASQQNASKLARSPSTYRASSNQQKFDRNDCTWSVALRLAFAFRQSQVIYLILNSLSDFDRCSSQTRLRNTKLQSLKRWQNLAAGSRTDQTDLNTLTIRREVHRLAVAELLQKIRSISHRTASARRNWKRSVAMNHRNAPDQSIES